MDINSLSGLPPRKSLGQHVFENLKKAIISGEFESGKRIVETSIAETLDISRTPVREAIHKLEREGFLKKQPRGGFIVLGLSRREIEETFGIRSVLESYAARLATGRHKKEDLKPLDDKIREYQEYLSRGDFDALPRINTQFHDLLYALSGSSKLIKIINDLRDQIYRFRQIILKQEKLAIMSHKDHSQMMKIIRKRDEDGVEKLVREHIIRGQDAVLKEFDSQRIGKSSEGEND